MSGMGWDNVEQKRWLDGAAINPLSSKARTRLRAAGINTAGIAALQAGKPVTNSADAKVFGRNYPYGRRMTKAAPSSGLCHFGSSGNFNDSFILHSGLTIYLREG